MEKSNMPKKELTTEALIYHIKQLCIMNNKDLYDNTDIDYFSENKTENKTESKFMAKVNLYCKIQDDNFDIITAIIFALYNYYSDFYEDNVSKSIDFLSKSIKREKLHMLSYIDYFFQEIRKRNFAEKFITELHYIDKKRIETVFKNVKFDDYNNIIIDEDLITDVIVFLIIFFNINVIVLNEEEENIIIYKTEEYFNKYKQIVFLYKRKDNLYSNITFNDNYCVFYNNNYDVKNLLSIVDNIITFEQDKELNYKSKKLDNFDFNNVDYDIENINKKEKLIKQNKEEKKEIKKQKNKEKHPKNFKVLEAEAKAKQLNNDIETDNEKDIIENKINNDKTIQNIIKKEKPKIIKKVEKEKVEKTENYNISTITVNKINTMTIQELRKLAKSLNLKCPLNNKSDLIKEISNYKLKNKTKNKNKK